MSTPRPSYRAVLRTRRAARSFLPSILSRLSLATSGLALVLLLQSTTGSFAIAGAVTAALGIANVIATPLRARLIDRRGQTVVLAALAATHAVALAVLALVPEAPLAALLVLAVIAGSATPPFATSMRVLWSAALPEGGMRVRGFSLDAVAGEVTYAAGPLVTAVLAVVVDPRASMLLSIGCVVLGAALFVTSPLSRERRGTPRAEEGPPVRSPLTSARFRPIVLAMLAPGIVLGAVDLAAPALAAATLDTLLAGVLLALFAGLSGASGLVFGLVRWSWPLERQLAVLLIPLLVVLTATGLVVPLAGPVAAVVGFGLGGLCLAPPLIVGYLAGDARAEPAARTEANSWLDTAVQLGAALGAALVGALTESVSPGIALAVGVAVATVIVAVAAPLLLGGRHRSARM